MAYGWLTVGVHSHKSKGLQEAHGERWKRWQMPWDLLGLADQTQGSRSKPVGASTSAAIG